MERSGVVQEEAEEAVMVLAIVEAFEVLQRTQRTIDLALLELLFDSREISQNDPEFLEGHAHGVSNLQVPVRRSRALGH